MHVKVEDLQVADAQITAAVMEEVILLPIATGTQGAVSVVTPMTIAVQTAEVPVAAPLKATAVVARLAAIAVVVRLAATMVAALPAAVQVAPMEDQMVAPAPVAVPVLLQEDHAARAVHQMEDLDLLMADHLDQARAAVRAAVPVVVQIPEGNLLLAEEPAAAVPAGVSLHPANKNKEGE